MYIIISKYS